MKWGPLLLLAVVTAMSCLVTPAANAQQWTKMTVEVPFDFIAGDSALNRGSWTIQRDVGGGDGTKSAMSLRKGRETVVVNTRHHFHPPTDRNQVVNKMVFNVYGDKHVLREVWINSSATEVLPYPKEEQLHKEFGEPRVVTLNVKQ